MPLYGYGCGEGHHFERVRPIGTDTETCPVCGTAAGRSAVNRTEYRLPLPDDAGIVRRGLEALWEREYGYQRLEQQTGERIPRPNDWALPKMRAAEMRRRGEVDAHQIHRQAVGGRHTLR